LTERSSQRRDARRVTVGEAAALLGISKEAVRMRIRRGTLRSEKTDDRVYVWLDDDINADQDAMHHADEGATYRELIEQLRGEVEAWREEARRKDHIIAGLIERLPPQLEAPPDEREFPEIAADEQQGRGPIPDAGGPREEAREQPFTHEQQPPRRGFWARLFGTPEE
jgi:excisionase family DNA binding protein